MVLCKQVISVYTISNSIRENLLWVLNFYETINWNTMSRKKLMSSIWGIFHCWISLNFWCLPTMKLKKYVGVGGYNFLHWDHNQNLYKPDSCHRPSNLFQNSAPCKCKWIIIHLYWRLFKNILLPTPRFSLLKSTC